MEIAANQKNYRMKQSWRQASMQVLNSSVARPWKLEQNTSGQASRQALRASRLWKLEQNNMTKKGPFFGPQNVRKSRRAKMDLPSSCRNHACRTTAEQRQLSLLASCGFQDKPIGNYLPQTPKKTDFGSKLEAKI